MLIDRSAYLWTSRESHRLSIRAREALSDRLNDRFAILAILLLNANQARVWNDDARWGGSSQVSNLAWGHSCVNPAD